MESGVHEGPLRQLSLTELGREAPTVLITNQGRCSSAKSIKLYAEGIDFFHESASPMGRC